MVLSGSSSKVFTNNSQFTLIQEWSATQSIPNNSSTIKVTVKIKSSTYGVASGWVNKNCTVYIAGEGSSFSFNPNMGANSTKTIGTVTKTVGHSNDGSKTLVIGTTVDYTGITWNGGALGKVTTSVQYTLNKIPRHSSISSLPNITIPGSLTVGISRQASSMTHSLTVWVAKNSSPTLDNDDHWTYIKTIDNAGTSATFSFTASEISSKMLSVMNGAATWKMKVKLWTNGVSGLSQQKALTVTAPAAGSVTVGAFSINDTTASVKFAIGSYNSNANFKYNIAFKTVSGGTLIRNITGVNTSSYTYNLTAAETNIILNSNKTSKTIAVKAEITTLFNGVKVRGVATSGNANATLGTFFNPTIGGSFTFKDTNTVSTGLTENNQIIVLGLSKVDVVVPANFATAKGGASISRVDVSVGSATGGASWNGGAQYTQTGLAPASNSSAKTIVVKVTDSRGFVNSKTVTPTSVVYTDPTINFTARRKNGFEEETGIDIKGAISLLTINGANKNKIVKITCKIGNTTWTTGGSPALAAVSMSGANYSTVNNALTSLSTASKHSVTVIVQDSVKSITYTTTIASGRPIMFMDAKNQTVSLGTLPTGKGRFEVTGSILGDQGYFWRDQTNAAIYLNNGDIAGVNGLWFGPDKADNLGEGIHFLTTKGDMVDPGFNGSLTTSANMYEYYDTIYWRDKYMYWDNKPILHVSPSAGNIDIDAYGNGTQNHVSLGYADSTTKINSYKEHHFRTVTTFNGQINADNQKIVNSRLLPNATYGTWQVNADHERGDINLYMNVNDSAHRVGMSPKDSSKIAGFYVGSDDTGPRIWSTKQAIYDRTYSQAANVYITDAGTFGRSTSASKYKLAISKIDNALNLGERLLTIEPTKWFDKTATETYAKRKTLGIEEEGDNVDIRPIYGLIAEDLRDVGLDSYVSYDSNGTIEGIQYDRLWTVLIPVIREIKEQIVEQEISLQKLRLELEKKEDI